MDANMVCGRSITMRMQGTFSPMDPPPPIHFHLQVRESLLREAVDVFCNLVPKMDARAELVERIGTGVAIVYVGLSGNFISLKPN